MSSRIIRFVLLSLFLVSVSVIGCREHAQDVCLEYDDPDNEECEIDMGCGETPIPGTCKLLGTENPTWTCVAI